ncbi:hypothetical protein Q7C36_000061 [Tachysurus vachellii]|uniref:Uncharacterized protein n=1 Tax=Tachysurus vachellii TaxID=175792 RepID=A0AA88TBX7_TACVA|nr:hypothetical protein Q7C36_000061 [Tachysurus vachellii]
MINSRTGNEQHSTLQCSGVTKDEHVANNAPVIKTHKKPVARSKIRRWVLKPPRLTGKLSVVTPEDEGL